MGIFNLSGKRIDKDAVMIGAILDTNSDENRFLAMKQLFDIGMKRFNNPNCIIASSELNLASAGAVCLLPQNPAMYEQYPIKFLYAKNGDVQYSPASTTKVMSIVTGAPYFNIGEKVTLEEDDIQSGSGNYFSVGDVLTVKDLIYGMMLPSSNTCAKTFAHYVGKKILSNNSAAATDCINAFVTEMNRKATELGCTNSYFDSPSGLSTTTLSTVKDLVRITLAGCSCNDLLRIWNKKTYSISIGGINPRTQQLETTVANQTLESSYYIFGGKTGHGIANDGTHYRALVMVAEPKT